MSRPAARVRPRCQKSGSSSLMARSIGFSFLAALVGKRAQRNKAIWSARLNMRAANRASISRSGLRLLMRCPLRRYSRNFGEQNPSGPGPARRRNPSAQALAELVNGFADCGGRTRRRRRHCEDACQRRQQGLSGFAGSDHDRIAVAHPRRLKNGLCIASSSARSCASSYSSVARAKVAEGGMLMMQHPIAQEPSAANSLLGLVDDLAPLPRHWLNQPDDCLFDAIAEIVRVHGVEFPAVTPMVGDEPLKPGSFFLSAAGKDGSPSSCSTVRAIRLAIRKRTNRCT